MSHYRDMLADLQGGGDDFPSMESSVTDPRHGGSVIIEDELHLEETTISKDIRTVLDRNHIHYVIDGHASSGSSVSNRPGSFNAVINGVYKPVMEDTVSGRGGEVRIKIVYPETLNTDGDADIYVVQDEAVARSMIAAGHKVAQYPNEIIRLLKQK